MTKITSRTPDVLRTAMTRVRGSGSASKKIGESEVASCHQMGGADCKRVAVVGAGAAGIVTAKSLLDRGLAPTVFEKEAGSGGLWRSESTAMWDSLRANISKYSLSFSDFPWPRSTSTFPQADEVGDYLERYVKNFLFDRIKWRPSCEVKSVRRMVDKKWTLLLSSPVADAENQNEEIFDHVVIASGFFVGAKISREIRLGGFSGSIVHSSQYRRAEAYAGRRVVVVGASFSGAEIAAEISAKAKSVIHVVSHPFYCTPRFLPTTNPESGAVSFLPLDLVFYRREKDGFIDESLFATEDQHRKSHAYLHSLLGDAVGDAQGDQEARAKGPPMVAVSDTYHGMLRSGRIDVQVGRLISAQGNYLQLSDGRNLEAIDDIVICTGYRTRLPFLDAELLGHLHFDPEDSFMPFLAHRSVLHPDLPGAALVGMYRGPFFGALEAQARWAAATFANPNLTPSVREQIAGVEEARRLRNLTPRPNFPHGDYVGFMDGYYKTLSRSVPDNLLMRGALVVPAVFSRTPQNAAAQVADIDEEITSIREGKGASCAIFSGLAGDWEFRRSCQSDVFENQNSKTLGAAQFLPISRHRGDNLIHHYREDGTIYSEMFQGKCSRQYTYQLDEAEGALEVRFREGDTTGGVLHRFHVSQDASSAEQHRSQSSWTGVGDHACGSDRYLGTYRFKFSGSRLTQFSIKYRVQGPKKDYSIETKFHRPSSGNRESSGHEPKHSASADA